jgi:uncharacterized protein YcbK (DUF882 family)
MKLKYFKVQEFVPKSVYKARKGKAIQLIDYNLLIFIERLRETLNKPITVNNWHVGGQYQYRGLRDAGSDVYSKYSQHSFGSALDFKVSGMSSEDVRQWIIDNRNLAWVKPITFIEDGVSWVHVDVRPTTLDQDLWVWHVKTGATEVYKKG